MSEVPSEWVIRLKDALEDGRVAVAESGGVARRVRGHAEFVKLLELDPAWNGEVVVCDSFDQGKSFLDGNAPAGVFVLSLHEAPDASTPAEAAASMLREVTSFDSLAALEASGIDFAAVVRTCLNWHGKNRASKSVVKAFANAFQATAVVDGVEVSRYSQAVEMLGYAAAAAPLLEPDRLVRLVALAPETLTAYQPTGAVHRLSDQLAKAVGRYSPDRQERLLADLWVSAHSQRWWDLRPNRALNDPFFMDHDEFVNPDPVRYEEVLTEKADALWVDGKLGLPAAACDGTTNWWVDQESLSVVRRLVERHGRPAYDALVEEATALPSFEDHRNQQQLPENYPDQAVAYSYPTLVALLRAEHSKDFADLQLLSKFGHFSTEVVLWPHFSDDLFEEVAKTLGVNPRSLDTVRPELLSAARSERVHEVLAAAGKAAKSLKWGYGSREAFCAALAEADVARRLELLESPHASAEDAVDVMRACVAAEGAGTYAFGRATKWLDASLVRELYPSLRVSQRSGFLANLQDNVLEEVLAGGLEADETIIGDAAGKRLQQLTSGARSHLYLRETGSLLNRVTSWQSSITVLRNLVHSGWLVRFIGADLLASLVKQADDPMLAQFFLSEAHGSGAVLEDKVWLAALEIGSRFQGVPAVDRIVARGFLADEHALLYAKSEDPDALVTAAHSPTLPPSKRPGTPVATLVADLVRAVADVPESEWPAKPTSWQMLVPPAGMKPYPLPEGVLALHDQEFPGVEGSKIKILRSPLELHRNAQHMGNCTFGYNTNAETGQVFLALVTTPTEEYNFAASRAHDGWQVMEVNSRFNRGNVPASVSQGVGVLLKGLA